MRLILVRFSLLAAFLASSTAANAFPDLIRKGYQTCFGCHVSPNGGGAINDYGRMVSLELATWGRDGEYENLWGLMKKTDPLVESVAKDLTLRVHGDIRYLSLNAKSEEFETKQEFWMQQEAELVIDYKNAFGLSYSIGKYQGEDRAQVRKAYVYANAGDKVRFRFGRFLPAYGTYLDDHTAYIRTNLGFNQGQETVNLEMSLYFKWIELFFTERLGREPRFIFDVQQGIRGLDDETDPTDIDRASVFKVAVYPAQTLTVGASVLMPRNNNTEEPLKYGLFGQWAFYKNAYLMTEFDVMHPDDETVEDTQVFFGRVGYEVFKGLVVRADYEQLETKPVVSQNQVAGSLAWIPRPHFELQFEASQTNVKDLSSQRAYQLVYHLWL